MTEQQDNVNDTLNLIAAQYVLGVLSASARERVKARMLQEKPLRDLVYAWERRLNPLAGMVAPEPVPPHLWQSIMQQIEQASVTSNPAPETYKDFAEHIEESPLPVATDVRYKRWRSWAGFSTAIAAALALFIIFDPNDIVPVVHLPPGQNSAQQVQDIAVLSNSDKNPAWIVRQQQGQLILVNLNAASIPARHDLELWSIQGNQPPRSLGVLHLTDGQASLASISAQLLSTGSVLAISLEPVGGSPTGAPTGAVLYSGSIIKSNS